jgi:hypothetical protein
VGLIEQIGLKRYKVFDLAPKKTAKILACHTICLANCPQFQRRFTVWLSARKKLLKV